MGRPKSYDRNAVLQRAMELFWLNGYDGTSTTHLAQVMGINRYSLYAEFGSKHGLYSAALDRYLHVQLPELIAELLEPEAGLESIRAVIRRFGDAAGQAGTERGCMACNAATERSHHDTMTRGMTARYIELLRSNFERAIRNAIDAGELRTTADPLAWSHKLTTTMLGLFVLVRSQLEGTVASGAAAVVLDELGQHRPGS